MSKHPRFSRKSLEFILKATRQKSETWLDRNREEYERLILEPMRHLASELKRELAPLAPGYNFPQKGLARLKRSAARAEEYGSLYRDYFHYSAARPRTSRFDSNPNIFLFVNPG